MIQQLANPYLPNYEYVPDAEPYVFGDRLYVFGSHDRFGGDNFCMNDYVGWSAPLADLSDWRYEGVLYQKTQDPWYESDAATRLFAPDVQQGIDGRYYLYYGVAHSGVISVAVCDTPAGAYQYYGTVQHADGTPLGTKQGDTFQYDPGVLVDDDGRVYLYSGFCFDTVMHPNLSGLPENANGAMGMELEQDMITLRTPPQFVVPCKKNAAGTSFEGHAFFEAPSIRKIGTTYYFIYSSQNGHELCYATAEGPLGNFVYCGILVSNGDIGYHGRTKRANYTGTNHGSIEKICGEWYVFYHRQSGGSPYARQGCAEKLCRKADGSFPQVQITSNGLLGKPFDGKGTYAASLACCLMSSSGACEYIPKTRVDETHPYLTQLGDDNSQTPTQYICNLQDGAKAGFRYFKLQDVAQIAVSVRGTANGRLHVTNAEEGALLAALPIAPSKEWSQVAAALPPSDGVTELWLCFNGEGSLDLQTLTLC